MSDKRNPPKEYRFVKGRSGNPLGRAPSKNDRELINAIIKFNDLVAGVFYRKVASKEKWKKVKDILDEK